MTNPESQYWAPRRLGHANLFIGSYERAADYYRDVVGFREVYRQPNNKPGVTSAPVAQHLYPKSPQIEFIKEALFHPKKVTHVALVSSRIDEMVAFYTGIIGLRNFAAARDGSFVVLRGTVGTGDLA